MYGKVDDYHEPLSVVESLKIALYHTRYLLLMGLVAFLLISHPDLVARRFDRILIKLFGVFLMSGIATPVVAVDFYLGSRKNFKKKMARDDAS